MTIIKHPISSVHGLEDRLKIIETDIIKIKQQILASNTGKNIDEDKSSDDRKTDVP